MQDFSPLKLIISPQASKMWPSFLSILSCKVQSNDSNAEEIL